MISVNPCLGALYLQNAQQVNTITQFKADAEKYKQLREVERNGRINIQKKIRENIIRSSDEVGYQYKPIALVESPFPDRRGQ